MRITHATITACILLLLVTSQRLAGQTPPPAAPAPAGDAAAALRGRDALSEQDKAALRQWVDARVQALAEAAKADDLKAVQATRKQLADAAGQGATAAFRVAFADVCVASFPVHLSGSEDARVALCLIQVLGQAQADQQPGHASGGAGQQVPSRAVLGGPGDSRHA